MEDREKLDELLGVTRCARCGHQLEGEIECPFCTLFDKPVGKNVLPKWIYLTACFLTSPFSIYFVVKSSRLNAFEKCFAALGCALWGVLVLTQR